MMNEYYEGSDETSNYIVWDCGCRFDILEDDSLDFCADTHNKHFNIPFDCPATYKLLSDGLVAGVFQLSIQGKSWCPRVKPTEFDHVIALGALLRPSCLESKDEHGDSTTVHYKRRKNNEEDVPKYNDIIDNILKDTYNCLIFQEQAIDVVKECAGFTPNEADSLRRAMGKKSVEEMQKNKKMFLEKAKSYGVLNDEQAIEVFNWIEASQRYSFNKAHSCEYAIRGYITAYQKIHFPIQFYTKWLKLEKKKENYIGLVNEAKLFDIIVNPPDIRHLKREFYAIKRNIYFGLSDIKGIVKSDIDKISILLTQNDWTAAQIGHEVTWLSFLAKILDNVSSKTAEGLINSGALDCFSIDRAVMNYEYEIFSNLTPTQKEDLNKNKYHELLGGLKVTNAFLRDKYRQSILEYDEQKKKRAISTRKYKNELKPPKLPRGTEKIAKAIDKLEKPLYTIQDTVDSIIYAEEFYLGVALTRHSSDNVKNCSETGSCRDIADGNKGYLVIKVKLDQVRPYVCKDGRSMAFIECSDPTAKLTNVVAFADTYEEFRALLTRDNLVFLSGKMGDKQSWVIKKVYPPC
jgi:DNA polymerase III alpha subunit